MQPENHITVCVCTYKRPQLLKRLLLELQHQKTDEIFNYSIVVVDNDGMMTANNIVREIKKKSVIRVDYYVEPQKNIALARNKAVRNAKGAFLAFIDDDEIPIRDWLLTLYKACQIFKADGVLGPVKPYYETDPPEWFVRGRFSERPTHPTGHVLSWSETRSGNMLIKKNVFHDRHNVFNPYYNAQGEDVDFFKRTIAQGHVFIWCNEAPVYELVPITRMSTVYLIKRAFVQGNVSSHYYETSTHINKARIIIKSLTASAIYTLILPATYLLGTHVFMNILIKDLHHISRLLAFSRIYVVKDRHF